jgi:hypothetical protein
MPTPMSAYEVQKRKEARKVLQKKLRRVLCAGEAVHHIDGNFSNNSPDNLMAMDAREHMRHHLHDPVLPYKKDLLSGMVEKKAPKVQFITTTCFLTKLPKEGKSRKRL